MADFICNAGVGKDALPAVLPTAASFVRQRELTGPWAALPMLDLVSQRQRVVHRRLPLPSQGKPASCI